VTRGVYVYGIVPAGALQAPPKAMGVDRHHAPALLDANGLTAIVSEVDVTEFEGDALERNLAQPEWLEEKVRGHESVLDAAIANVSVVPMRFGSIFSSVDGLRAMLFEHGETLRASLERVRGRSEWGVKVHCDRSALVGQLAAADGDAPATGRGYLMQKKAELDAEADAAEAAAVVAADVHASLAVLADDATTMTPRGYDARSTVLNGAYLVADAQREALMRRIDELQTAHGPAYVFEVTGPWPPYNFTSADVAGPRS
jgi:Gas vesicle synthesis protein GvpL/GvpF